MSKPTGAGYARWLWWIIGIPIAVLALFIGAALLIGKGSAEGGAGNPRLDFFVECQEAARARLKAPDTARFGPETYGDVLTTASGYRLSGTLTAQNSFGVPLQTAYACDGAAGRVTVELN